MDNDIVKKLKNPESLISLVLGVVVVVLAGVLVLNMAKGRVSKSGSAATENNVPGVPVGEKAGMGPIAGLPTKHVVKEGETLWSIAVSYYKSGYNWVTLAQENNLVNPDYLVAGEELNVPEETPIYPEGSVNGVGAEAITQSPYKVKKGDSLWTIACQAYTNCYKWTEIAKANNLINPNLIEVDQDLKLPR